MAHVMPPERYPHARTWMGWPPLGGYIREWGGGSDVATTEAVLGAASLTGR